MDQQQIGVAPFNVIDIGVLRGRCLRQSQITRASIIGPPPKPNLGTLHPPTRHYHSHCRQRYWRQVVLRQPCHPCHTTTLITTQTSCYNHPRPQVQSICSMFMM